MFDMMKMMGKVQEMQKKMKEVQEGLVNVKVTAEAGAGMVKATVNCKKQVVDLQIDKDVINPDDPEMMNDLIVAAVNKALEEADAKAKEEVKKQTEGMMPNIPGLDLGNLF